MDTLWQVSDYLKKCPFLAFFLLGYSVAGLRLFKKKCLFLAFFLPGYSVSGSIFFLDIANLFIAYIVDEIKLQKVAVIRFIETGEGKINVR